MRWTTFVGACVALALSACGSGPKEAYYGMVTAAEMGDREGFLDGFSEKSQRLIAAQISLSEAYDGIEDPIRQLVFERVDAVEVSDGEAILDVRRGNLSRRILMIEDEEKGWVIDVDRLASFWEKER